MSRLERLGTSGPATVAIGSTLASTAVGSVSLSQGAAGLLGLFGLPAAIAVVLETTGDLSVLTADRPMDAELLRGVRGADRL